MILLLATIISWTALFYFSYLVWRQFKDKKQADRHARMKAQDIFTLHPGTKGLITDDPDDPLMWMLPSGRIVYHRYWERLEGVKAQEI